MSDAEGLLEVVVVGLVAGVGLTIVYSLTIAETIRATAARREHRRSAAVLHGVGAVAGGLVCIASVVLALVLMLGK